MPHRDDTSASDALPVPIVAPRLADGERFGEFEIVRALGSGGMGEVYEAVDSRSGHRLAVKILLRSALETKRARERFLREGVLAASINHPNSLYVYGTEEVGGLPLIAMELAPGGTLDDRVKSQGPFAPDAAARAALQVVQGLNAAAERGVLHRDVKPSNCFVDRDGTVKVGDFGLSVSRTESDATQLTASGAFLGTPAYASPEQMRGHDLDVRSDIYSVGATLYFLLTGERIFHDQTGPKLIASILEKEPTPIRQLRPEIPTELATIVHRCLAKDPDARFPAYDALTQALRSVVEERTPRLRTRFGAGLVDELVLAVPSIAAAAIVPTVAAENVAESLRYDLSIAGIQVLYGAILEGRFGMTLGKALFGLRVTGTRGGPPGLAVGLLRSLAYRAPETVAGLLAAGFLMRGMESASTAISWVESLLVLLLFVTARRATGLLAIHDRITGTRVVLVPPASGRSRVRASPPPALGGIGRWVGPFRVEDAQLAPGSVVFGYDEKLQRSVWIEVHAPGAPAVPQSRRETSRQGCLRWLHGRREATEAWDAYEAIDGALLAKVAPQPWSVVRHWLRDLADELAAREHDTTKPVVLSVARVWITTDGRAMLLDVSPPGHAVRGLESAGVPDFLLSATRLALTGKADGPPVPSLPIPLPARDLLERLSSGEPASAAACRDAVVAVVDLPPLVTRGRRTLHHALSATLPALVVILGLLSAYAMYGLDAQEPSAMRLRRAWRDWKRTELAQDPLILERRRHLETYLAGVPAEVVDRLAHYSMRHATLTDKELDELRTLRENSAPTDSAAFREAETALTSRLSPPFSQIDVRLVAAFAVAVSGVAFAWLIAPIALVLGLFTQGGLMFKLLGIAIVRRDGRHAPWWQALLRNLVAWTPAFVMSWFVLRPAASAIASQRAIGYTIGQAMSRAESVPVALASLLFVMGVAWSIARPSRALQDRIARTWLVPR